MKIIKKKKNKIDLHHRISFDAVGGSNCSFLQPKPLTYYANAVAQCFNVGDCLSAYSQYLTMLSSLQLLNNTSLPSLPQPLCTRRAQYTGQSAGTRAKIALPEFCLFLSITTNINPLLRL